MADAGVVVRARRDGEIDRRGQPQKPQEPNPYRIGERPGGAELARPVAAVARAGGGISSGANPEGAAGHPRPSPGGERGGERAGGRHQEH